ncbi:MAG: hypothetical protein QM784_06465 [Polyangiaceae bacterium]
MRRFSIALATAALLLGAGCTVGEGDGEVTSDKLIVKDCWEGAFDLGPTFFGANAFDKNQLSIRVQRGDNNQEVSDGLEISIRELQTLRASSLGSAVDVGLPPGVHPPGSDWPVDSDPPTVSLALYLHDTCHAQNGALYAVRGTITFKHLFSGDANESSGDERLTEAEFDASFGDPRDASVDGVFDDAVLSRVTGWFRFFFQRGQPAQPFP